MKKFPWLLATLYTVLGLCFGALVYGLIKALSGDKVIGNADVAAWVQALSALAALVAAIGIADHQSTIQRRTKREAELRDAMQMSRLAAVAARRAVPCVENFVGKLEHWPKDGSGFQYDPYEIVECKALIDMAVAKVIHPDLIEPLVAIHRTLGAVLQACKDLQGYVNPASHSKVKVFNSLWMATLATDVLEIETVAKDCADALQRFDGGRR